MVVRGLVAAVLLGVSGSAWGGGEPLSRRAWLGAALEAADGGVRVKGVMAGGSAEAAGLTVGDVITSVNGEAIEGVPGVIGVLKGLRGGEVAQVRVSREGQEVAVPVAMKEWPREEGTEAYGVEYGDVSSSAGRMRTITYVPRGGEAKKPALLLIQGLSAATLDNPSPMDALDKPKGMGVYRTIEG